MAKILSIVGTLSGSINGTTYSHNKGGAYIRARKIPTIPPPGKADFAKALFGGISPQWNTLTDTERAQWRDWAAINPVVDTLGSLIQLSGQQAFIGLNSRLLAAGGSLLTVPPVDDGPAQIATLAVVAATPDQLTATWTPVLPTGGYFALWASLPSTAGRNPNVNQARLIGYSAADDTSPQTFTSPYPFSAGNEFNAWGSIVDSSGRMSPRVGVRVVVP